MAHPFPTTEQATLCRLTENGMAQYRKLNDRDEKELEMLRAERTKLSAEIASIDDVMADLHETIGRRQAKMRGDVISLLPTGGPIPPLHNTQGDLAHGSHFAGRDVIEPTRVQGPGSFAETKPDGHCVHCGEPVWQVSVTPASPKGYRHSYGATCNPDDPHSGVAELDERAVES